MVSPPPLTTLSSQLNVSISSFKTLSLDNEGLISSMWHRVIVGSCYCSPIIPHLTEASLLSPVFSPPVPQHTASQTSGMQPYKTMPRDNFSGRNQPEQKSLLKTKMVLELKHVLYENHHLQIPLIY